MVCQEWSPALEKLLMVDINELNVDNFELKPKSECFNIVEFNKLKELLGIYNDVFSN